MSKQTKPITNGCGYRGCRRAGLYGVFAWKGGATDVDLNDPKFVTCGPHKMDFGKSWMKGTQLRNVLLNKQIAEN